MAFTIVRARDQNQASRIRSEKKYVILDDAVYEQMFKVIQGPGRSIIRCPLFNRMYDPYRHYHFQNSELPALMAEIKILKDEPSINDEGHKTFAALERLCSDALNGNLNIYAFGD